MQFAFCHLSVVPLRKTPSDTSEMVSQILFGETFRILEQQENWYRIKLYFDDYEGFIDKKQCCILGREDFKIFSKNILNCTSERVGILKNNSNDKISNKINHEIDNQINNEMIISLGSSFPTADVSQKILEIPKNTFHYAGKIFTGKKEKSQLISTALLYLQTPYLWGGRSIFGIDCSGFTQMVYKINGFKLRRDAHQQATQGFEIPMNKTEKGDLAFFKNKKGKISHVGLVLESNKIIHAHGKVKIDFMDEKGIFNSENKNYSHHLHSFRKIF